MDEEYFFRIKLSYKGYDDLGGVTSIKEESLAMCVNYSDAESVALNLLEDAEKFNDDFSYEVIKTKIKEIAFNDTFEVDNTMIQGLVPYYFSGDATAETGLYAVSIIFNLTDENTGKETKKSDTIYVPAENSSDAIKNLAKYFHQVDERNDYVIRNVKYDKAVQVLVTPEKHKYNTSELL